MTEIESVVEVFDNGCILAYGESYESRRQYKIRTGAGFPVATRWIFAGSLYENPHCPIPIPDMSGLVYATEGWKSWVVLNPDGTQKCVIPVPVISDRSIPAEGDIGDPRYMKGDPTHIMYGEGGDGDRYDCRFYFDMHNGKLVRVDFVGRHW